jgi:hypothetical protein
MYQYSNEDLTVKEKGQIAITRDTALEEEA